MKYFGMPMGMWTLFAQSFRTQLTAVFGCNAAEARSHHPQGQAQIPRDHP